MPSVTPTASVAELAARLLEQIDGLANELATQICRQIDVYGAGNLVERSDLQASLVDNLSYILGAISGNAHRPDLQAPRRIGRIRAGQGVPLPEVLRAYRFGFTFVWQWMLDLARESGPPSVDAILDTATTMWQLADDYSQALTDAYRQTLGELLIAADRRRSGIISAILDGPHSHSAWEVAKLLDLPYEGSFLVVMAEAAGEGQTTPLPLVDERLRALDVSTAWRSQPDHEIGVLSLTTRTSADDVLGILGRVARGRVGVSPLFTRLDGATRALRLAQVALETLSPSARGIRQLPDTPQVDLLVRDRETTRRYVLRVLHRVLALPDDDRATLLATATAWVDAHGSAAEASRVLYCHENTVRYRIHRLEEHLGVSLDDSRNLGDLTTALQAIRIFPEFGNRLTDAPGA